MALTVMNNSSAAMALGELNKNSNRLSKDLKKVSSGTKITGAGDGASEYAISEGMRSMIRALEQDIQNSKTGRDLVKVAEGGIQSIIEELRTLKELALNSANDHNSAVDRATLQKEFDQRMANIDNIAEETNYNGKLLLNGTYRRMLEGGKEMGLGAILSSDTVTTVNTTPPVTTSTTSTSVRTSSPVSNTVRTTTTTTSATMPATGITEGNPVTTTNTVRSKSTTGPTKSTTSNTVTTKDITKDETTITEVRRDVTTTNTTNTTVEAVTDTTTTTTTKVSTVVSAEAVTGTSSANVGIITNGMTTLTEGGVWKFAEDYTGDLTINADNVTIIGAAATLQEVYITGNSNNIYLKDVHINNTQAQDKATINFINDGVLHVIGDNSLDITASSSKYNAAIHANGNLSIVGNGRFDIKREGIGYAGFSGAVIGANYNFYGSETGIADAVATCGDINIGAGLTLNITELASGADGASIGGARGGSCGDISIGSNANITITRNTSNKKSGFFDCAGIGAGAGTGSGNGSIRYACCGNIIIYSDAVITVNTTSPQAPAPAVGTANYFSKCRDIEIYSGAQLNLTTQWVTANTIYMRSGFYADDCAVVGTGPDDCSCGNITVHSNASISTTNTNGDDYGSAGTSSCGIVNLSGAEEYIYSNDVDTTDPSLISTTTYNVTTETITTSTTTTTVNEIKTTTYETSTETREDITTAVYEKTAGEEARLNIPLIIHTGPKANEELRVYIEDMGPEALGILDMKIDPREAAVKALGEIDHAIDYALEQATQMGAYISRLEQTEENLVIASENAQSSESTIRDADMVKEMTAYMRDNILSQSAQAMLAQANQNASGVLGLLQ